MTPIGLAILLFVIAAALLVAEMLLPSHGVLGGLAVLAMVAGVVVCYRISHALALYVALGLTAAAPVVGGLWMKLWPKTPLGRRVILGPARPGGAPVAQLAVGATGVVVSELRPMGVCEFDGERVEARAEHGVLPAGRRVAVIAVVDGRPTVRPA